MGLNEEYNRFLDKLEGKLSEEDERESQKLYENWRGSGRLSDLELAMFMSDKLDNITEIMHKSDELRSRDGKISRIERTTRITESDENAKLKKEIDSLKGDIQELKELLIKKLS